MPYGLSLDSPRLGRLLLGPPPPYLSAFPATGCTTSYSPTSARSRSAHGHPPRVPSSHRSEQHHPYMWYAPSPSVRLETISFVLRPPPIATALSHCSASVVCRACVRAPRCSRLCCRQTHLNRSPPFRFPTWLRTHCHLLSITRARASVVPLSVPNFRHKLLALLAQPRPHPQLVSATLYALKTLLEHAKSLTALFVSAAQWTPTAEYFVRRKGAE